MTTPTNSQGFTLEQIKAYAAAGARIRCGGGDWFSSGCWGWVNDVQKYEVHPDDLHLVPEYAPAASPAQPQAEAKEWQASTCSPLTYRDAVNWEARADELEADLANAKEIIMAMQHVKESGLSRLRPLAEAGPVPEGAVRVGAWQSQPGEWFYGWHDKMGDTHFADILLPEAQPAVEAKPEPETFEAHGKTWTRHTPGDSMPCDGGREVFILCHDEKLWPSTGKLKAHSVEWGVCTASGYNVIGWRYADSPPPEPAPPWQPAVGNVVRLKSGGPEMTIVSEADAGRFWCNWFTKGERHEGCWHPSTLELVKL